MINTFINSGELFADANLHKLKTFEDLCNYILSKNKLYENKRPNIDSKNRSSIAYEYFSKQEIIDGYLELDSTIFMSYNQIVVENVERAPGAIVSNFGYMKFAHTDESNGLCIDLNFDRNFRVVLVDHSKFSSINYYSKINGNRICIPFTQEIVDDNVVVVSNSFESFLKGILDKSIDLSKIDKMLI